MARRWAARHGLADDDLIVSRSALDELLGKLYCLQAAVDDVERDLADGASPAELGEAMAWLLENARPLRDAWLEPRGLET